MGGRASDGTRLPNEPARFKARQEPAAAVSLKMRFPWIVRRAVDGFVTVQSLGVPSRRRYSPITMVNSDVNESVTKQAEAGVALEAQGGGDDAQTAERTDRAVQAEVVPDFERGSGDCGKRAIEHFVGAVCGSPSSWSAGNEPLSSPSTLSHHPRTRLPSI